MAYDRITSHDEYLKAVEQYQNYEAGTYQSMTLKERMDFFDGIHTNHVPLFDEDGDDMDTADDYYEIRDDFLNHPEQFALDNILDFIEMLDDSCDQPSFMDTIINIIHHITRYYQLEGVTYLLSHFREVPERGYTYGLFWSLRSIINDETVYPLLKEALGLISPKDRELVRQILAGKEIPKTMQCAGGKRDFPCLDDWGDETELRRKAELEELISRLLH